MLSSGKLVLPVLLTALVVGIVWLREDRRAVSVGSAEQAGQVGCRSARKDFQAHSSGIWMTVRARVERLLPDETGQYRHQRFIVRCPGGQTLLIVNNVSVGSRVPAGQDRIIVVHGQYVWNSLGGLVHFTHHDPEGTSGGWILYNGRVYASEFVPPSSKDERGQRSGQRGGKRRWAVATEWTAA